MLQVYGEDAQMEWLLFHTATVQVLEPRMRAFLHELRNTEVCHKISTILKNVKTLTIEESTGEYTNSV